MISGSQSWHHFNPNRIIFGNAILPNLQCSKSIKLLGHYIIMNDDEQEDAISRINLLKSSSLNQGSFASLGNRFWFCRWGVERISVKKEKGSAPSQLWNLIIHKHSKMKWSNKYSVPQVLLSTHSTSIFFQPMIWRIPNLIKWLQAILYYHFYTLSLPTFPYSLRKKCSYLLKKTSVISYILVDNGVPWILIYEMSLFCIKRVSQKNFFLFVFLMRTMCDIVSSNVSPGTNISPTFTTLGLWH